jgi:hypothetical protein
MRPYKVTASDFNLPPNSAALFFEGMLQINHEKGKQQKWNFYKRAPDITNSYLQYRYDENEGSSH